MVSETPLFSETEGTMAVLVNSPAVLQEVPVSNFLRSLTVSILALVVSANVATISNF